MNKFVKVEFECLCNIDCDYCHAYRNKHKADPKKVIREMEQIFARYHPVESFFRIEGIGEITLYPEIIDYLAGKAKREGYFIEVLTNGVLARQYINDTPSLKWVVSLDGHTAGMNAHRKLVQAQVNTILDMITEFNTEIQCVYCDQTMAEVNGFIQYLKSRDYSGFLHISPRKYHDKPLEYYLDYHNLEKADFIADEEYFNRWKFILTNQKRDFPCDFFSYGYVYRIMRGEEATKMVKCDCSPVFEFEVGSSPGLRNYKLQDCGTCICQFEYDVSRKKRMLSTTAKRYQIK